MRPAQAAVRVALMRALCRLAAVAESAVATDCALLAMPHAVAPAWPWSPTESLCAAAQLACYEAACETLLPALAQWGRAPDCGPRATFAGQAVRNALTQLRDLPLVSAGRDRADAVVWHLLTTHQFKFAVAADARLGPLALLAYLAALHTVAVTLEQPPGPALPGVDDVAELATRALSSTWQLAAAARSATGTGELP